MRVLLGTIAALTIGTSAAMAADLPVKARPMVVDTWSWNGFYIGLNGGYSWGRSHSDVTFFGPTGVITPPPGSATTNNFNLNGGVFGGQAGWNWQTGSWVWGFETDLQWSRERGTAAFLCAGSGVSVVAVVPAVCVPGAGNVPTTTGTTVTMEQTIEWFGTFRARAGMLVTPSVLAYVTGGLAYGSVKTDLGISVPAGVAAASSSSTTRAGWTIGAGLEAMFARNWSGKLEYLYVDLGSFDSTVALAAPAISATVHSRVTDNIFRAGINYHFDPGPVVARY